MSQLIEQIRAGDRVTITNRFGQYRTGRAVMFGPAGWVLNMGGRHGTPAIADASNIVSVQTRMKLTPTTTRTVAVITVEIELGDNHEEQHEH